MRQNTLKRFVLVCRASRQCLNSSEMLHLVLEQTSPSTVWFRDEPNESWWACNTQGWQGWGVVVGAQGMAMRGSRQRLDELNHTKMRGIPRPWRYGTAWLNEGL